MRKKYLLLLLPFIVLSFTACEDKGSTQTLTKTLRPVKYMTAGGSTDGRTRTYSGTSQAKHEAKLSFRVGGIIQELPVKVGDELKRGDIIAGLEQISFEIEVAKQNASLAQMEADRRKAESDYQRTKALYENDNVSLGELETSRTSAESARALVSSAKKTLKLRQLDLGYTQLRSKRECSVTEVFKDVNENVTAGSEIVAVSCGKIDEIKISVPENIINTIEKGMSAKVRFVSIADREFEAKVTELSVSSSSSTTFPVILTIDDLQDPSIRSGMATEVTFTFRDNSEGGSKFYLPPVAVGEDVKGRYVFVLMPGDTKSEKIVRRQAVEIGDLTSLGLEVTKGVEAGDKIVTAGTSVIYDGLHVKAE